MVRSYDAPILRENVIGSHSTKYFVDGQHAKCHLRKEYGSVVPINPNNRKLI